MVLKGSNRVSRGGSWINTEANCRTAISQRSITCSQTFIIA